MNRRLVIISVIAALVLLVSATGVVMASDNSGSSGGRSSDKPGRTGDGDCNGEPKMRMLDRFNLTEEQKEEIINTVKSMKEDGKDRDEIRDTVVGMLKDYGVDIPEGMGEGMKERHQHKRRDGCGK